MNYKLLPLILLLLFSFKPIELNEDTKSTPKNTDPKLLALSKKMSLESKCKMIYSSIEIANLNLPNFDVFLAAFQGYEQLLQQGKIENEILTIVDFSLSSKMERLWVINMKTQQVLLKTLVAHGKNSGLEFASNFSNEKESFKSSLGFFSTAEVYQGKHGTSLRLDGLEYGVNDNARERAVVIHGADYVSKKLANAQGYIGRSLGCPAVSLEISKHLIETIKDKSCFFIYHPSRKSSRKTNLVS